MCGFPEMAGCSDVASTTTVMVAKSAGKPVGESRKIRKPLMEKRRRARINQSLNELKKLLLDGNTSKKEGSRPAKLEKADILEMTVQHLQRLHQQQQQERVTPQEIENASSPQLEKIPTTQPWPEHPNIENKEKYATVQHHRPSSTVPDALCGQQMPVEPSTTSSLHSTLHRPPSPTQSRYYDKLEGSSSPKFRAGFSECAREAREVLSHFDDVDPAVRERLSNHLSSCLNSLESRGTVTSSCSTHQPADSTQGSVAASASNEETNIPSTTPPSVLIQTPSGLTLLPTKLPNGDLAFVIPADIRKSVTSCFSTEGTKSGGRCNEENKQLEEVMWRPW